MGAHRRALWRIVALVAVLRTRLRLPLAQVQWFLAQLWGLRQSVGDLRGLDPLEETVALLRAPRTPILDLAPV